MYCCRFVKLHLNLFSILCSILTSDNKVHTIHMPPLNILLLSGKKHFTKIFQFITDSGFSKSTIAVTFVWNKIHFTTYDMIGHSSPACNSLCVCLCLIGYVSGDWQFCCIRDIRKLSFHGIQSFEIWNGSRSILYWKHQQLSLQFWMVWIWFGCPH